MRMSFILAVGLLSSIYALPVFAESTRFEKLEAVLEHLNLPTGPTESREVQDFDGTETRQNFELLLKYIDPKNVLQPYLHWDDNELEVFQDRDTKLIPDYTLTFKNSGAPTDTQGLSQALQNTSFNSPDRPLHGLRVALDPGHMGGIFWDRKTGKYLKTSFGYVSEGVIALHTCLLLSRELEALGAEVLLTRTTLAPVSEEPLNQFQLAPYSDDEILSNTDLAWFDSLLSKYPLGPRLFAAFDQSSQIRHMRSEDQRDDYFIKKVDLRARAEKINSFKPHLTVVIHFDAEKLDQTQDRNNSVRGYVPGNLLRGEASSPAARLTAVRNLVDGHRWLESSSFTETVVKNIAQAAHINIQNSPEDYMGIRVTNGVYARNLALNRLVSRGAMSYIEVEHYDFTLEFRKLARTDKHTEINGIAFDYSSRLEDFAQGIKMGILEYVKNAAKN